jgi:beta-galactosidase GanA
MYKWTKYAVLYNVYAISISNFTFNICLILVLCSYVEWSLHEPFPGVYNFEGIADLEYFIKLIKNENMYLILRPGPYICAERDFVSTYI